MMPVQAKQSRPPSLARSNVTACDRCRRRKKRCDQKLPSCSLCKGAGVECVGYDAVAQKQVSRSYVYDLENEVVLLRSAIQQLAPEAQCIDRAASDDPSPTALHTRFSGQPPRLRTHDRPGRADGEFRPSISSLLLDTTERLDRARRSGNTSEQYLLGDGQLPQMQISHGFSHPSDRLPTRAVAQYLVKIYFEFANFHLPLLHEPTFRQNLDAVYADFSSVQSSPGSERRHISSEIARFFVDMVFALALLILQKYSPSKFPALLCDQYYEAALKFLKATTIPETTEGTQALSLVAQYAYLHPLHSGGWNMAGAALRHAVELGFHEDPTADKMDCLSIDTRRRTFWVVYSMERNIAVATGRPYFLSDGAITAQFPAFVSDEHITASGMAPPEPNMLSAKTYSFHWLRYRQLQSEMCTVLREKPPTAWHKIDYDGWQKSMRDRIREWYDQVCQESQPHMDAVGNGSRPRFDLTYQRALFLLYRPCRSIPSPAGPARLELVAAASKVITLYKQFYNENRIHLFWQAAANIYDAGTTLMSSYTQSDAVRQILSARELEELTHLSSTVLWALTERYPPALEKRDAFERVRARTLSGLGGQGSAATASQIFPDSSCVQEQISHNDGTSESTGPHCQIQSGENSARDGATYGAPSGGLRLPSDIRDVYPSTTDPLVTEGLEAFWNDVSMPQALAWTSSNEHMELDALAWDWE